MTGTIAVIVVSYNRPRMIAEALASIDAADQVIVADDGSDFDLEALAEQWAARIPRLNVLEGTPRTPAERMRQPSCGRMLNDALRLVDCDYVSYICDDDVFAPGWLSGAKLALDYYKQFHMVRGDWRTFHDGESLEDAPLCKFVATPPLTTGNFVMRMSCVTEENCWWGENTLAVHDATMLHSYVVRHRQRDWLGNLELLAGYRREHPKTISNHSRPNDTYTSDVEAMFAEGSME